MAWSAWKNILCSQGCSIIITQISVSGGESDAVFEQLRYETENFLWTYWLCWGIEVAHVRLCQGDVALMHAAVYLNCMHVVVFDDT